MLNKMLSKKHAVSNIAASSMRAFSAGAKPYAKEKIVHAAGLKEQVRPEYTEMYNDLSMLIDKSMPMIK
jgi:hypothetical protein